MTHEAGSRAKAAGLGPCSVRPGEAWREQRLSCFSSSMPIMSKGTEEAPNSGEPGESTVSLEGRKGRAEATQCCGQAGSSRFLARGHSLGCGCPLTLLGLQGLLPFHPASTAGLEQARGMAPSDTRPCQVLTAAHACSLLPLQCACCAAGHRSTRTSAGRHLPTVGSVPTSSAW